MTAEPQYRPLITGELATPELGDQRQVGHDQWVPVLEVYAVNQYDLPHRRPLIVPKPWPFALPSHDMTEKQLELAAREYCRLMGMDPEEQVAQLPDTEESTHASDVLVYGPQWMNYRQTVRHHAALDRALRHSLYGYGDGDIFK